LPLNSGKPACASFPRLGWGRGVEVKWADLAAVDMVAQGYDVHKI